MATAEEALKDPLRKDFVKYFR
jgi:hypothetical protein